MARDEIEADIRWLVENGFLECLCTRCGQGVRDENLQAMSEHRAEHGHPPELERRDGAVVRRWTGKEWSEDEGADVPPD